MIKLYWWNKQKNFGDELSPMICNMLSEQQITHAEFFKSCDLIAIGSLLQHVTIDDYDGAIWGSGFISSQSAKRNFTKSNICAVRGEFTREMLGCKKNIPLGDPGLLSDMLIVPQDKKKYKLGVIPHYVDANSPAIDMIMTGDNEYVLIDITSSPMNVLKSISECSYIVSTCLHGLIAADSLNIPNCWIKVSEKITGGDFKFHDYYSAFSLYNEQPIEIYDKFDINIINNKFDNYKRPNIKVIKQDIISSFPYLKDNNSLWAKKRRAQKEISSFISWQYTKFNNFFTK